MPSVSHLPVSLLLGLFMAGGDLICESPTGDLATLMVEGAAAIERGEGKKAVKLFERCAKSAPGSAAVWVNLALAHLETSRYPESVQALAEAERLDPRLPHITYILGLCQKHLGQPHLAVALFRRLLATDPACAEAHYNLGVLLRDLNQWDLAREHFEKAADLSPDHLYTHYHLMRLALLRSDNQVALEEFRNFSRIRSRSTRAALDVRTAERSRYCTPLGPSSADGWDRSALPDPFRFTEVEFGVSGRPGEGGVSAAAAWCELGGDEKPDLVVGRGKKVLFLINRGDFHFDAVSPPSGAALESPVKKWVVSDFDNDRRLDLLAACPESLPLYLGREDELPASSRPLPGSEGGRKVLDAVAMDYDHDGDLDVVTVEGGEPSRPVIIRNNGDGTHRRMTETLEANGGLSAIAFGDLDRDVDLDLLFAGPGGPPQCYLNLGAGRFRLEGVPLGLDSAPPSQAVFLADFDNNLCLDILLLAASGVPVLYLGQADGRFQLGSSLRTLSSDPVQCMAIGDLDNDGFLDLLLGLGPRGNQESVGVVMARGSPSGLEPVPESVLRGLGKGFEVTQIRPQDADADGDLDLLLVGRDGSLKMLRNDGGNANHWLRVSTLGQRSNTFGVGAQLEVRDGWRRQRRLSYGMPVHIGLGKQASIQVLRLLWPTGLVQNHFAPSADQALRVTEDARIPSSCPFLFARGPQGFEFVADFLGGGALGEYGPPGHAHIPDPDDVLFLGAERLVARNGTYSLRATFELQEVIYVDRIGLSAVFPPPGATVVTESGLHQPPRTGVTLHAVKGLRPVRDAWDTLGNRVADRLAEADAEPVSDFRMGRQPGLTHLHSVTLDLGDELDTSRTVLLLRGWTDWPNSSGTLARSQSRPEPFHPPWLEMRDGRGQWQRVPVVVGVPAGKLRQVFIDLRGAWLSGDRRVRISTDLAVFWDEARVCEVVNLPVRTQPLSLSRARLRWRGYSTPRLNRDRSLELYDYSPVLGYWPWRRHQGSYTGYGEVQPLVEQADSRLVVAAHGDELDLEFTPCSGPEGARPEGFVFHAIGWGKDADPNTADSSRVEPLPTLDITLFPEPSAGPMRKGRAADAEPHRRAPRYVEISLPRAQSDK